MKTYYSDWLQELEWYALTLLTTACCFASFPECESNPGWLNDLANNKGRLAKAEAEKKLDTDTLYDSRLEHINGCLKNMQGLDLSCDVQEYLDYFNASFSRFLNANATLPDFA